MRLLPSLFPKKTSPLRFVQRHAFTLVETLMAVTIIAVMGGVSIPLLREQLIRNQLNQATNIVTDMVRTAQLRARAGETIGGDNVAPEAWGVNIPLGILFNGSQLAVADDTYNFVLPGGVSASVVAEYWTNASRTERDAAVTTEFYFQSSSATPALIVSGTSYIAEQIVVTLHDTAGHRRFIYVCYGGNVFATTIVWQGQSYAYSCNDTVALAGQGISVGSSSSAAPAVALAAESVYVVENDGSVTIPVARTGGGGTPLSVEYTINDGTAAEGSDYTGVGGTIVFGSTEYQKDISIPILNDDEMEGDERLSVTLTEVGGGALIDDPVTATITIIDDDAPCNLVVYGGCPVVSNLCPGEQQTCDLHIFNTGPNGCADVTAVRTLTPGAVAIQPLDALRLYPPNVTSYQTSYGVGETPTVSIVNGQQTITGVFDGPVPAGFEVARWDPIVGSSDFVINDAVSTSSNETSLTDNIHDAPILMNGTCPQEDYAVLRVDPAVDLTCPLNNSHKFTMIGAKHTGATSANVTITLDATCDIMPPASGVMVDGPPCSINGNVITCTNVTMTNGQTAITFGNDWNTAVQACVTGHTAAATAQFTFQPGGTVTNTNTVQTTLDCGEQCFAGESNVAQRGLQAQLVCQQPCESDVIVEDTQVNEADGNAIVTIRRLGCIVEEEQVHYHTSNGTALSASDFISADNFAIFPAGSDTVAAAVPIIDDAVSESLESFTIAIDDPSVDLTIVDGTATVYINDDDGGGGGAIPDCDLSLFHVCNPEPMCSGESYKCDGHVTNLGPGACRDTQMELHLPADIAFSGVQGTPGLYRKSGQAWEATPIVNATVTTFPGASNLGGDLVRFTFPNGTLVQPGDKIAAWFHATPSGGDTSHRFIAKALNDSDLTNNSAEIAHTMLPANQCPLGNFAQIMVDPFTAVCDASDMLVSLFANRPADAGQTADIAVTIPSGTIDYFMAPGGSCTPTSATLINCTGVPLDADGFFALTFDLSPDGSGQLPLSAVITWPGGEEETVTAQAYEANCPANPDPNAPGNIVVDAANAAMPEGGVVNVLFFRDGIEGTVTVSAAAVNGTAVEGVDFDLLNSTMTFLPGQVFGTISVLSYEDTDLGNKAFSIQLSNVTGGASIGSPSSPSITIVDNDGGASVCGDAIVDAGEQCDDGNATDGDGCSSVCVTEFCGDGTQNNNGEECDDGNAVDGDGCSALCVSEYCGDATVQSGLGEQCDDGNATDGDGCSSVCATEFCGDSVLNNNGEECDDGNAVDEDGCSSLCVSEYCGDATVQSGLGETCDDGNATDGDGCSSVCQTESSSSSSASTSSSSSATCGDFIVDAGEDCDDGGVDTVQCDSTCLWTNCGNGHLNTQAGEQCDDGNVTDGDGCSSTCQSEGSSSSSLAGGCTAVSCGVCTALSTEWSLSADSSFSHASALCDGTASQDDCGRILVTDSIAFDNTCEWHSATTDNYSCFFGPDPTPAYAWLLRYAGTESPAVWALYPAQHSNMRYVLDASLWDCNNANTLYPEFSPGNAVCSVYPASITITPNIAGCSA